MLDEEDVVDIVEYEIEIDGVPDSSFGSDSVGSAAARLVLLM